jgi:hypothetical protein
MMQVAIFVTAAIRRPFLEDGKNVDRLTNHLLRAFRGSRLGERKGTAAMGTRHRKQKMWAT